MATFRLTRRHVLRGALGGVAVRVALPLLDLMHAEGAEAAAATAPRRFVVFFWGNGRGVVANRWTPATTGAGYQLSPQLTPLAPVKDYINVVTNFDVKIASDRGHHRGSVAMLSGDDFISQDAGGSNFRSTFKSPSIDQVAAAQIGTTTPFKSLELGVSEKAYSNEGTTCLYISHNGPDNANPAEHDPSVVFSRLFAGSQAPAQTSQLDQARSALHKSVLDVVLEDANALKSRVSVRDQARLDQHMANIRQLEQRIDMSGKAAVSCQKPNNPGSFPTAGGKEPLQERITAMSQLVSLAFSCDITRVASIQYTASFGDTVFWQLNETVGHHERSHEGAGAQTFIDASTSFMMGHLNVLLSQLKATVEGSGNLLDQSVVVATTDCSDGSQHSTNDMPIVVAGKGGGALRYPGVHHRGNNDNTTSILLSALRAAGVNLPQLGGGGGLTSVGVPPIEA